MTDSWDPSIPEHKALAHEIELGNGIPEMRHLSKAREAIKAVGFRIEHEEDLAERPDVVPWYYPLEGDIFKAQTAWDYFTVWRMSWSGKLVTHNALRVLEFFHVVPKGTWEVGETLRIAGDALVKGGQTKVSRLVHDLMFLLSALRSFLRQCTWSSRENLKAESVTSLHTYLYP
jgi:sterol 24-C-methyltransferase